MNVCLQEYISKQIKLYTKELEEEEKLLLDKSAAKVKCMLKEKGKGGGGQQTLELSYDNKNKDLDIKNKEWVGVSFEDNKIFGIVTNAGSGKLSVDVITGSLREFPVGCNCHVFRAQTSKVLKTVLSFLEKFEKTYKTKPGAKLVESVYGDRPLSNPGEGQDKPVFFFNKVLNQNQKDCVQFCIQQKEIAVIHGPPGTGKTTTLVEIIYHLVKEGKRVFIATPSNIATDNIVCTLVKNLPQKMKDIRNHIIRLGHPGRFLPDVQAFSINAHMLRYSVFEPESKDMSKRELNKLTSKSRKEVLEQGKIICGTLLAFDNVKDIPCDDNIVVIIDECGQARETECWVPALYGIQLILAGDHQQLPPTVLSSSAAKEGLSFTLMEHIINKFGDSVTKMLDQQYRMNEKIMLWPSTTFYGGKLKADISVASHLMCELEGVQTSSFTDKSLVFLDTASLDFEDCQPAGGSSRMNVQEAKLVCVVVNSLLKAGVTGSDIGIISPYNLQVHLIASMLPTDVAIEVQSVDGFQGREKEAIIISMVRSNKKGVLGFLDENRRINVAVTRARRLLILIGDSATICQNADIEKLYNCVEDLGEVTSAVMFQEEINTIETPDFFYHLTLNSDSGASARAGMKMKKVKRINSNDLETDCERIKENVDWITHLINNFINSSDESYIFPPTLSFGEHQYVEELSRKSGLFAFTEKSKKDSIIIVCKKREQQKSNAYNKPNTFELEDKDKGTALYEKLVSDETGVFKNEFVAQCDGKTVETKMEDCHEAGTRSLHMPVLENQKTDAHKTLIHKSQKSKEKCVESDTGNRVCLIKERKPVKGVNEKCTKREKEKTTTQETDIVWSDFQKGVSECGQTNCNASVKLYSVPCDHCKLKFCLQHRLPEVHGCGDEAHTDARLKFKKPGSSKVSTTKRTQLQGALKKKMDNLSSKRKGK